MGRHEEEEGGKMRGDSYCQLDEGSSYVEMIQGASNIVKLEDVSSDPSQDRK